MDRREFLSGGAALAGSAMGASGVIAADGSMPTPVKAPAHACKLCDFGWSLIPPRSMRADLDPLMSA